MLRRQPATAPYNNPPYALLDKKQSKEIGILSSDSESWARDILDNLCSEIFEPPSKTFKLDNCEVFFFGTANESCEVRIESKTEKSNNVTRVNFRRGISAVCLCNLNSKKSVTTFSIENGNLLAAAKGKSGLIIAEIADSKTRSYSDSRGEIKWDIICLASNSVIDAGEFTKIWWVNPPMCTQHEMNFPLYKSCRVCSSSQSCNC